MALNKRSRIAIAIAVVGVLIISGGLALVYYGAGESSDKMKVVASFYPLYYFSSEIGKDEVDASMLIPDNAEPHSWEPRPSDVLKVDKADVLVYNGQGFEPWMSSFLGSTTNKDLIVVDTSQNVSLRMSSEAREVYEEAVGILNDGASSSAVASSSEESAPVVEARSAKAAVTFSDLQGGKGGFIALNVPEGGDYRFFVTNDTSFKVLSEDGTEISYEMDNGQVSWYPQFKGAKFFELEAGEAYRVSFGPSPVSGTDLIMVHAAEEEGGSGEEEHHHGLNDPHFWLDPLNAKVQVDNILAAFVKADPEHADFYRSNAEDLRSRLDALNQEFVDGLADRAKNAIITTHEGFDYLADRYGFQAYGAIGISGDEQPSAQDLKNLAQKVKDLGLHYVFAEPIYSDAVINTVASETGAQVLVLDGIHGRAGVHENMDYFQIMEANLQALCTGLEVRT